MYRLMVVDDARRELDKETAYSMKRWGYAHGRHYTKTLRARINGLRKNPRLYRLRNDIMPGIRILEYKGSRIVYTLYEDRKLVVVLAVLSHYQDLNTGMLSRRQRET